MDRRNRFKNIIAWFETNRPEVETELNYRNPYELLVAVMLSAQCTDKRVNLVTPALFERFPTPELLSESTPEEVLRYISSISYPNSKAEHLVGMAKILVKDFGSVIPSSIDSLQTMPGVGRKTANVVSSIVYDTPVIAVDTHIFRVARRLGLSDGENVRAVEDDLTKGIPKARRSTAHHWFILHGRYVCVARKPKCDQCGLTPWCRYYEKNLTNKNE